MRGDADSRGADTLARREAGTVSQRDRLVEILAMTSDQVSTYDMGGTFVYLNDAARRFLGYGPDTPAESIHVHSHLAPSTREVVAREIGKALASTGRWTGELEVIDRTGAVVPMHAQLFGHRGEHGMLTHVSAVCRDLTERKSFERVLRHQATHDPLTALPNRTLLLDRLVEAIARGRRHGTGVAVLFCDLDHFKVVNDRLGHSRGDVLLTHVARRVRGQLRPGDTVARFGGDEFVVVGEDCASGDDAMRIAMRIDEAIRRGFDLNGAGVDIGVSIGISLAGPVAGWPEDPESLIRDADAAMYQAKQQGRGRFHLARAGHPPAMPHR